MKTFGSLKLFCFNLLFFPLLCRSVLAQEVVKSTEHLDADRPEAWAMSYFSSVSLLAGLGTPYTRDPGSFEIGFEADWIPQLSKSMRRVGFNGIKEEDLNKAPVFMRPRVTLGLPWKFALTLSYLPPIGVFGVEPDLFAFALERPLYERTPWTIGVRAYGQVGTIEGAFTCPSSVAKFPVGSPQNLFGCERTSEDRATQRYGGLEFSGSYRIERLRGLTPYIAMAGNFLDSKFRVRAQTFGFEDRRRLVAETWTFAASAGVTYPLTERLSLSVGLFYSPLWVTRPPDTSSQNDPLFNVRSMLTYRFF
jgi:hypothetical protein